MLLQQKHQQQQLQNEINRLEDKQKLEVRSLRKQISDLKRELKDEKAMQLQKPENLNRTIISENIGLNIRNKQLEHALLEHKRDGARVFGQMIEENWCYKFNDRSLVTMQEWIAKYENLSTLPALPFNLRRNKLYF